MRVTIKDVAERAGVSPSTVTRVIQDKPTISQATKERVRQIMKELDYHPNLNARSLVSSETKVLGLVLPDDSDAFYQNSFFPTVLRGISQISSEHHYALLLSTGRTETERLESISQMVRGRRVDGLIFLYAKPQDPLVQFVREQHFPFLILGKSTDPFTSLVDNDNRQAGADATHFLLSKGYKRIAFLAGSLEYFVNQDRFQGYQDALEEAGLPMDEKLLYFAKDLLFHEGYQVMENMLEKQIPLDAIIVTDSLLAEGVASYLQDHQLHLPCISFTSLPPTYDVTAYVDIQALELGQECVETLLQIIQDHKKDQQTAYQKIVDHNLLDQ